MNWGQRRQESGFPLWHGTDSVTDVWNAERWRRWWRSFLVVLPTPFAAVALVYMAWLAATEWRNDWTAIAFLAAMGLGFGIVGLHALTALFAAEGENARPKPFISRVWVLGAWEKGLAYSAGEFDAPLDPVEVSSHGRGWKVDLDAIARVESGLTADWQPARRYEGAPWNVREGIHEVPKVEYQTFLLMNDGSRRIIQTVNADREGSATLAHSIRTWIEEHRASLAAKNRDRGADDPAREGFDL